MQVMQKSEACGLPLVLQHCLLSLEELAFHAVKSAEGQQRCSLRCCSPGGKLVNGTECSSCNSYFIVALA